jgi:membrane protein implicated in regulation of membrane protease activity
MRPFNFDFCKEFGAFTITLSGKICLWRALNQERLTKKAVMRLHIDGATMEHIYWYLLIGGVIVLIIVLLLGDLMDAITGHLDVLPFGPSEIVLFASFLGGVGLIFQKFNHSVFPSIIISATCAFVLTFLISYFFLRPLKHMENSSAVNLNDMVGRKGIVTMEIKEGNDSLGEVKVEHDLGYIFRTAISRDGNAIPLNAEVTVWEVKDNRFVVYQRNSNEIDIFKF